MLFEPADLLLFWGRGLDSRVIEWATLGPSHIGGVCPMPRKRSYLWESTTLCDLVDEISGEKRKGVQAHCPEKRIAAYDGEIWLMRLADGWKLDAEEIQWLFGWLWHRRKQVYDLRDAMLSGTRLLKWTRLMPYPEPCSVFCSMLWAAALMRLHRLPLDNPAVYNPASLVRELRRCGVYEAPKCIRKRDGSSIPWSGAAA